MRQAITFTLACTVLGGMTAIGVAWIVAVLGETTQASLNWPSVGWVRRGTLDEVVEMRVHRVSPGQTNLYFRTGSGRAGVQEIDTDFPKELGLVGPIPRLAVQPGGCHPPVKPANMRWEGRFGWPAKCMWSAFDISRNGLVDNLYWTNIWHVWVDSRVRAPTGWPFYRLGNGSNRFVPTGILWPGIMINTACFATAWWLILVFPFHLRTRLRRRWGLCPACAYDLRGVSESGCPECGWNRPPIAASQTTP